VFLAIGLSAEVVAMVARLQGVLAQGALAGVFRFVDPEQAHVTLRFLGQQSGGAQVRIVSAAAAVAARAAPFSVAFGGLGVFPDERRPNILWLGLTEGRAALIALGAELETALGDEGFAAEGRPFVPHLTLARVDRRPSLGMMKNLLGVALAPKRALLVDRFMLMESRSTSKGVRYLPLQIFRLESECTRFE